MTQTKRRMLADDGKRQLVGPCPRCGMLMGLWFTVIDGEDRDRLLAHMTDYTAALSEPKDRQAAMRRSTEARDKAFAGPWVDCSCGYSGLYWLGTGGAR